MKTAAGSTNSPQRSRERREFAFVLLMRGQKDINCHFKFFRRRLSGVGIDRSKYKVDGLFVFRPLNGKQKLLTFCELCASAVKYLFLSGNVRESCEYFL